MLDKYIHKSCALKKTTTDQRRISMNLFQEALMLSAFGLRLIAEEAHFRTRCAWSQLTLLVSDYDSINEYFKIFNHILMDVSNNNHSSTDLSESTEDKRHGNMFFLDEFTKIIFPPCVGYFPCILQLDDIAETNEELLNI